MVSVSWLYPDTTDKFQAHYSEIPLKKEKEKCINAVNIEMNM